ncbi:hypothetical protein CerSpe_273730 [Prunus speciosa]
MIWTGTDCEVPYVTGRNSDRRKSFHNGCSDSSSTIPNGSNSINSSTMSIGNKKINSIAKTSSRKKSRKKGKQSTKVSNVPEVLSEEYANGSSASEPCGNNDGDEQVSSSTAPEISLPDSGPESSETPNTCTSSSDEVGIPSVGNYENQLLLKDSGFPIFDEVEGIHTQVSCYSDMYTKGYSDMHDSFVLDSISIGSNSGDSANAGHDEKHAEKEIFKIDISNLSSEKGRFSCQRFLNDVVGNYDHIEEARHGIQGCRSNDMQLVVPNKRSKQNKVAPQTANVSKFGSNGNLHIHYKQNKLILSIN